MGIVTPDILLRRRVDKLERLVGSMASQLFLLSRPAKDVVPLSARLWRCTLNEDMGASTGGQAAADLVELDGTDTGLDVTVKDLLSNCETAKNTAGLFCFEQLDMDGTRYFVALAQNVVKTFCRFTLDEALATTDASCDATITAQYGPGDDHATTDITLYNVAASSNCIFEGASGAAGIALWDHKNAKWWIVQMECP
jgi:hypothetical protein